MGVNRRYGPAVRRTSYPSGPWVDAAGRPCHSPNTVEEPHKKVEKSTNPDPNNYIVEEAVQVQKWLVVRLHYPDCTNYEGRKILVFKDLSAIDLLKQKFIDPHFYESDKLASPIARFVPTDEGWTMALRLANMMQS